MALSKRRQETLEKYERIQKLKAEGFLARAICHEYDHLDGIVYTDKARNIRVKQ